MFDYCAGQRLLVVHKVCAGSVYGNGIKGGEYPHISDNRRIVARITITRRAHIDDEIEKDRLLLPLKHSVSVLYHLLLEEVRITGPLDFDGALGADSDALATADARPSFNCWDSRRVGIYRRLLLL